MVPPEHNDQAQEDSSSHKHYVVEYQNSFANFELFCEHIEFVCCSGLLRRHKASNEDKQRHKDQNPKEPDEVRVVVCGVVECHAVGVVECRKEQDEVALKQDSHDWVPEYVLPDFMNFSDNF